MTPERIIEGLMNKYGEHFEMTRDPKQLMINILVSTLRVQLEKVEYLSKVNSSLLK